MFLLVGTCFGILKPIQKHTGQSNDVFYVWKNKYNVLFSFYSVLKSVTAIMIFLCFEFTPSKSEESRRHKSVEELENKYY